MDRNPYADLDPALKAQLTEPLFWKPSRSAKQRTIRNASNYSSLSHQYNNARPDSASTMSMPYTDMGRYNSGFQQRSTENFGVGIANVSSRADMRKSDRVDLQPQRQFYDLSDSTRVMSAVYLDTIGGSQHSQQTTVNLNSQSNRDSHSLTSSSTLRTANPTGSMNYLMESDRRLTFKNWGLEDIQPHKVVAAAGFIYVKAPDMVRCAFCGGYLHDWDEDDVPFAVHKRFYPKCQFVLYKDGQVPAIDITKSPYYKDMPVIAASDGAKAYSMPGKQYSSNVIFRMLCTL